MRSRTTFVLRDLAVPALTVVAVPEPSTLLAAGTLAVLVLAQRRGRAC